MVSISLRELDWLSHDLSIEFEESYLHRIFCVFHVGNSSGPSFHKSFSDRKFSRPNFQFNTWPLFVSHFVEKRRMRAKIHVLCCACLGCFWDRETVYC